MIELHRGSNNTLARNFGETLQPDREKNATMSVVEETERGNKGLDRTYFGATATDERRDEACGLAS